MHLLSSWTICGIFLNVVGIPFTVLFVFCTVEIQHDGPNVLEIALVNTFIATQAYTFQVKE